MTNCPRCHTPLPGLNSTGVCAACLLGDTTGKSRVGTGEDWLEFALDPADAPVSPPTEADVTSPIPATGPARFSSYELLGEIARGGMGIVYRARQRQPDRLVALKVLLPRQADAASTLARFRAEAAIVAGLDHPNLLPVYETGEHAGLPFFSMRLVEGGSLAGRIGDYAGRPRAAARLVTLAAGAVHHAHQRGVLHRDLKPGNILLHGDGEPTPYVTDFGIAKVLDSDSALTLTHDVLGTPAYASPEQARPGLADVTTAADVYGLGAVLYELLAQRPPFTGPTPLETLRKVTDDPPVPPRKFDPHVPRDLETICLKCLQKNPSDRYASAAGLAADLERFLAGETVLARPAKVPERVWRWSRRNPVLASLWTALALLLAVLTVSSLLSNRRLQTQNRRALQAEKTAVAARNEAIENLRASYLVGARALRGNARAGHRFEALALLKKAADIRPGIDLRNEAIAAFTLTDVRLEKQWTDAKDSPNGPVAFDPTLQFCASTPPGQTTSIWRSADRQTVCALESADADHTRVLTLGPWDGTYLPLVTEDGTVRVYRTDATGHARLTFALPAWYKPYHMSKRPGRIAFSPDSKRVAIGVADTGGISLRDPDDGRELSRLAQGHEVDFVAFNADGSRLVFATRLDHKAHLWNLAENREERIYPVDEDIISLAVSVPDRLVALGTNQSNIILLDYVSGAVRRKLSSERGSQQIAFDPRSSLLASTGRNSSLSLWQPLTGDLLVQAPGLDAEPALRFSMDGGRIAISQFQISGIGIARLQSSNDCVRTVVPAVGEVGHQFGSFDVSPDGRLFATASRQGVWLGDVRAGQLLAWWPLSSDDRDKLTLQFTADGRGLVGCSIKSGRWYRALTWDGPARLAWGQPRRLDDAPGWLLTSTRVSGGLGAFVRDNESEVIIRPVDAPGPAVDPKLHFIWNVAVEGNIWQAALGRDGRYFSTATQVASASNPGCRVWETATRRLVWERKGDSGWASFFSPSGRYFYANTEPPVVLETENWQEVLTLPYNMDDAAFSPDDRFLALRDDSIHDNNPGTIRLYAMPGGEPLAALETSAREMRFTFDNRYLVIWGTSQPVQIWDLHATRRELRKIGLDWSSEPIPAPEPEPPLITVRDERTP